MERATNRISKELKALNKNQIPGLELIDCEDLTDWKIKVTGAEGSLYEGEEFTLLIRFDARYPIEPPECMFSEPAPVHPHIYSNGHICLSVLYDDWSPAMGVSAICLSVLSMLSSAEKKEHPSDNASYVAQCKLTRRGPKQTSWWFHDDKA